MVDIIAIDKQRELVKAHSEEFWFNLGVNARRLFPGHGLEWVSQGIQNENASVLIRKGWETEHERQLKIN